MNACTAVATAYDQVAPWYDVWEWQTFWERNEVPLVRAEVSRRGYPARAVDLGTGTGRYVAALRAAGVDTFGVDVSQEMISIAAGKLKDRDRLIVGDLRSDALALGAFELAIAARVFCHIEDIIGAFRAASNLVMSGGQLIVTELDSGHDFERTRVPTPAGRFEIDTWKRSSEELILAAESVGWRFDRMLHTAAADCAWLPEDTKLTSINRASGKAIFNVLSFCRSY